MQYLIPPSGDQISECGGMLIRDNNGEIVGAVGRYRRHPERSAMALLGLFDAPLDLL